MAGSVKPSSQTYPEILTLRAATHGRKVVMVLLTLDAYRDLVDRNEIDTVICALPDCSGRLIGKRLTTAAFQSLCIDGDGVGASKAVFTYDFELEPMDLAVANAATGWKDFHMQPELATLRRVPWEKNAAFVLCDAVEIDTHELVEEAPRTILKRQLAKAREHNIVFKFASELEFYLSKANHDEAWALGYQKLPMLSDYRNDYQLIQSGHDEWFIHQVRTMMNEFGISIESSKTEWGLGQNEITLDYCEALEMADRHVMFKHGVKELANRAGLTATFMAKPSITDVGSSCHIHASLWDANANTPLSWGEHGMSEKFGQFVAGNLKYATEFGYLFAPTINSYKRYISQQFAGTTIALGFDNRSCAFRLVGSEASFRVENRIPGADANPYYAYSGMIMAGLSGMEEGLSTPEIFVGDAETDSTFPRMPSSMQTALEHFVQSDLARRALGPAVFNHIVQSAQHELNAFQSGTVTDWELKRYYERV